ncbi:hypothetical protein AB0L75_28350 [Streptomyces sp. NPDC052101]|uniref:hypothetical protein n=1 Tax=Streptomyces sp. NPDC052101 TaxID=3155763 RepID=UPI0034404F39
MIPRIHERGLDPAIALAKALGRRVGTHAGPIDHTVIAHWPGLDAFAPDDEHNTWTSAEWAEHLDDPTWQHPFITSPQGEHPIWHADIRLHPRDDDLTGPEWSEIAHRLIRTADIHTLGEDNGCRWIAVKAQPGRLDLIANLVRSDGSWKRLPHRLGQLLANECRRIESDLGLIAPQPGPARAPAPVVQATRIAARHQAGEQEMAVESVEAAAQLGQLLKRLTDEDTGPLATVRGLVEHAAYRFDRLPHPSGAAAGHQLALIASRLYGIQQDLDSTAAALPTRARTAPPAALASVVRTAGRARPSR